MYTIVDASNRDQHRELLDSLFWARYNVFVIGRGWDELARPDGRDIDQYDDRDTVYVIGHEGFDVFAGARMRHSSERHLLRDTFSHLCEGPVPAGDSVVECSRLFVERDTPNRAQEFVKLLHEIVDWYLSHGYDTLTGVIENWWLNSFLGLGFDIRPLGRTGRGSRSAIVGVQVTIDEMLADSLRGRLEAFEQRELVRPTVRRERIAAARSRPGVRAPAA